jgi:hypothetical protein
MVNYDTDVLVCSFPFVGFEFVIIVARWALACLVL